MTYTVISLFAGIGGMDLAFEAAGFEIVAQVEIDDFCTDILSKRWPDVYRVSDVRTCTGLVSTDADRPYLLSRADVIIGGFPCQDISAAGKGAGIRAGTRSGLWFEFARLIGELRPRLVLLENVSAILARDGDVVVGSLAEMGYDARWGIIRASDAGAAHQRARWFCVADTTDARLPARQPTGQRPDAAQGGTGVEREPERRGAVADTEHSRCEGRLTTRSGTETVDTSSRAACRPTTESRLGGGFDGVSSWMERSYQLLHVARPGQPQHAWEPPRVTDRRDHRAQRLKALGNAVVPQVIYPIAVAMREWLEAEDA